MILEDDAQNIVVIFVSVTECGFEVRLSARI